MSPIVVPLGVAPPATLYSLQIGRLTIGPAIAWDEPNGDPIGSLGGAVVPAARAVYQAQVTLATMAADGQSDTLADRQRIRRALRALLNNDQLKLQGFLYVVSVADPEQDGWWAPNPASFQDPNNGSAPATGFWQAQSAWSLLGHRRTHREARQVWLKDISSGGYDRDTLGWIRSPDFSSLPKLALTVLPHGATGAALTVSGQAIAGAPMPTGRDGGQCTVVQGLSDLQVVSYERPESALNLSDVIVYDRRGQITAPASGPDTGWEEVYGPDYPWNWQTAGQPADCPVLDNGLLRIRWDSSNTPGFRVDAWNGTAYVEQGKMLVYRKGDTNGNCDTWVSAGLHTENGYTPERAAASVVVSRAADTYSRERVFITLQRGELGATFEVYPALKSAGGQADAVLLWYPALNSGQPDVNTSVVKSDTETFPVAQGTGVIAATAGTGSALLSSAILGAASFAASENYVALLRCPTVYNTVGPYQVALTVQQGANADALVGNDAAAYGTTESIAQVQSQNGAGYLQVGLSFAATTADQVIEAESCNTAGTNTQVADATASGGTAVKETQTASTNNTLSKHTGLLLAKYRCFARVKCGAGSTGGISAYLQSAASGGTNVAFGGAGPAFTNTTWAWIDLGEALAPVASPWLAVNLVQTAGTAGVFIDRVELVLVEDRSRNGAIYSGCRDAGAAALLDSRTLGRLTVR